MENLGIRAARERDMPALFPIVVEFATLFVPKRAPFEEACRRILINEDACLLVAELEARAIIGYLLGFEHAAFYANGPVSWVEEIAVTLPLRRKGVGRALMTAFEVWARARGSRLVALATRRAARFYSVLGYEESASSFRKVF